jgi:hypothetical protein
MKKNEYVSIGWDKDNEEITTTTVRLPTISWTVKPKLKIRKKRSFRPLGRVVLWTVLSPLFLICIPVALIQNITRATRAKLDQLYFSWIR